MVGSRITSVLRSALPATAVAAAALILLPAPAQIDASAAGPATCMPHCDNALYPFTEYAQASVDAFVPGAPSRPAG